MRKLRPASERSAESLADRHVDVRIAVPVNKRDAGTLRPPIDKQNQIGSVLVADIIGATVELIELPVRCPGIDLQFPVAVSN